MKTPLYEVRVRFNQHYEATWLVRAASAVRARALALTATRKNRLVQSDLRWYHDNYTNPKGYTMARARVHILRADPREFAADLPHRSVVNKPYLWCCGT